MIMNGREKCRFLKEIRKEIAERNGIEYLSAECHSSAACPGHCPKCDAESRYLDMELSRLANSGKEISFVQTVLDAVAVSFGASIPTSGDDIVIRRYEGHQMGDFRSDDDREKRSIESSNSSPLTAEEMDEIWENYGKQNMDELW